MKLRIHRNSIRLRLSRSDVAELAQSGRIIERVAFGPGASGHFTFSLETSAVTALAAHHVPGHITLIMPQAWAKDWPTNDTVGFDGQQEITPGEFLKLLIEKDFACIDNTTEDQSDTFPNPAKHC